MKRWCALCTVVLLGVVASTASHAGEVVLQNRKVRIALDEARGFALSQIQDAGTGKAFYLPVGDARKYAALIIDVENKNLYYGKIDDQN